MGLDRKFAKLMFTALVILALAFVTACGSQPASSPGTGSNSGTGSNTETKGGSEGQTYTLRYNVVVGPATDENDPKYFVTEKLARLIEERTNGRVKVEVYYNGQLAGMFESVDALAKGTIDMAFSAGSFWSSIIPEGMYMTIPFAFLDEEQAYHLLHETDVGKLYEEALDEYGVKLLSHYYSGDGVLMSKKPIRGPADFKGLVINQFGNKMDIEIYKKMGAGTASVPTPEMYEAFLRGTIDGTFYPVSTVINYKYYEVIDYITVPRLTIGQGFVTISKITWDKLPADIQQIIADTAMELEKETIEASRALSKSSFEQAQQEGVEVVQMDEQSFKEYLELSKEVVMREYAPINERTKKIAETIYNELDRWMQENPDLYNTLLNVHK